MAQLKQKRMTSLMLLSISAHLLNRPRLAQKSMAHFMKVTPSSITIQTILDRGAQMPPKAQYIFISALKALGLE